MQIEPTSLTGSPPLRERQPTRGIAVFTRYPEPGKTKTRLIPLLGPKKAAGLQRQMTEHTLNELAPLVSSLVQLTVHYTGAEEATMRTWLGESVSLEQQRQGDLGVRMAAVFEQAFAKGMREVVIVGIDCPELSANHVGRALHLLRTNDLVLGPAADGGYYLIGLRTLVPELFENIAWGTDSVRQRTLAVAEHYKLKVSELEVLRDVDLPEDLGVWQAVESAKQKEDASKISVIIPTFNEATNIDRVLAGVLKSKVHEILIADGGSEDDTVERAKLWGAKVINTPKGRAAQMNTAAKQATGDILLFLHADTELPDNYDRLIKQALKDSNHVAGAFTLRIDGKDFGFRVLEHLVAWRSKRLQMPYGDQAIFMRAKKFRDIGGFKHQPIMEDFELMRKLRKQGRVAILSEAVTTSARRWQRLGKFRTTLVNQRIILAYLLGISPKRIASWYR